MCRFLLIFLGLEQGLMILVQKIYNFQCGSYRAVSQFSAFSFLRKNRGQIKFTFTKTELAETAEVNAITVIQTAYQPSINWISLLTQPGTSTQLTLMYGSDVPPMSRAGNSEHWIADTFRVWALKSYSSWK